ncbi:MAG: NAD(P)-dependent glycerol-3-phosphate dehydrogenase [Acidobacteria bacterium]|nr:NAD(P)-dependent glycerol-3-phosphate dehydrogenase [Acidobacteriota bacterium]
MGKRGHMAVVGAGSWGTAFASVLASNHLPTVVWARRPELARAINAKHENPEYLPGIPLPTTLRGTADIEEAVTPASVVVVGLPSHCLREKMGEIAALIPEDATVVSLTKGVEPSSLLRMSEVIAEAGKIARERIAVVSGPNLAKEVARGLPGAAVVACPDEGRAERLQRLFHRRTFRVYTNTDVCGVEIGGAAKNVVAIAAGIARGLEFGDNSMAALITRGLVEITRLGVALGADPLTFAGLAGIGDLVATCTSPQSRNRHVGEELGKGRTLDDVLGGMKEVAEGVKSCRAIVDLAARHGVDMPIASRVARILYEGADVGAMVEDLITRDPEPEFLGIRGAAARPPASRGR